MSNSYKNVAAKVLKMIKSVGEIPRNGSNPQFNYKFVKETDVADKLRESCMAVGLVIIPSVHDVKCETLVPRDTTKKDSYRTSLMLKLTLVDPDTGESMDMDFPGEAIDTQDKATPKAITSAYKYALLKLAMNGGGDGDDPEHVSNEQGGENGKTTNTGGQAGSSKPVSQGTSYRKFDEAAKPAGQPSTSGGESKAQPSTSAQPTDSGASESKPAPAPAAAPTQTSTQDQRQLPISEDFGTITAVIPAMKGKPASISFKPKEGGVVYAIQFNPATTNIPELLKIQQTKTNIQVITDIIGNPPFLMSFKGV